MLWSTTEFFGDQLGVSHGIRWNMVELYFGGGYMRLPTRIRWKNMGKHGKTTNPSRPFRRFEVTISFRISQALTNITWLFLKLKLEQSFLQRGGRRTKSKITAETVAAFRSFQYLSVVARKKEFYEIFQMLFVTWSELYSWSKHMSPSLRMDSFCSETLAETGEGPAQSPETQKQVAWPMNQLESQGEKLKSATFSSPTFPFQWWHR